LPPPLRCIFHGRAQRPVAQDNQPRRPPGKPDRKCRHKNQGIFLQHQPPCKNEDRAAIISEPKMRWRRRKPGKTLPFDHRVLNDRNSVSTKMRGGSQIIGDTLRYRYDSIGPALQQPI
jgi:hypothetical protein